MSMFVVFFMARSGSKFLGSLLNQHPDIIDSGEAFHSRPSAFTQENSILMRFSEIALRPEPVKGFEFRYPRHVREFPEIFELIEKNKSIKIILLKRRSKLKGAISQQNSEILKGQTGKAHLFRNGAQSVGKLTLDVSRALKEAQQREELDAYYRNWAIERFETLGLYYEDLCSDPENEINKVCRFLDCSPFKKGTLKESNLAKVTRDNIEDAINNYSDLKKEVERFGRMEWLSEKNNDDAKKGSNSIESVEFLGRANGKGTLFDYSGKTRSGNVIHIQVEGVKAKTNTRFLEWVKEKYVIASQGNMIKVFSDRGIKWKDFETPVQFRKSFTTVKGDHLFQASDGTIYRYDKRWRFSGKSITGDYPWHGAWSIDQNKSSEVIIWGEYPYCSQEVCVWRSTDGGVSWDRCFTERGHQSDPKGGDIRHFHVVQKCTGDDARWYLSSGDTGRQSKFWVSEDDGEAWKLIPISKVVNWSERIPETLAGRLHRFTALVQTEKKLVWVTDDTFEGTGARLCFVDKDDLGTIRVAAGTCGTNEIRNLIKVDSRYALAVSESKRDAAKATLALVDFLDEKVEWVGYLPNERGTKGNFMNGQSAASAIKNVFYSQSDNVIIHPAPMTLRWRVDVQ